MHDLVISGGVVVDGTGESRTPADVAIDDGIITEVGNAVGSGRRTIAADGQIVSPGFVDVHTHLDVQGFWDPQLTPSPLHGVTTAVGGNCGFTVSPLCPEAADYLMRMLAKVEGMPLEALQAGVPWDWQSTAEYLDRLDGQLSLNAGFSVGHSAMRQVVMGDAARERHASAGELQQMVDLLRAGLTAGALGFTSTWSTTHNDADAKPVPSRWASGEELIALASVCREFPGTSLEFLPSPGPWDAETERVMVAMTVAAARPLNWNLISATEQSMPEWEQKLALSDRARQAGGKIVGLVLPRSPAARFSFYSGMVLDALPGWAPILGLPYDRRLEALKDPECRLRLDEGARQPGPRQHFSDWGGMRIVETFSEETKRYVGALVGDIARDNSKSAFDALLDIVVADQLKTSFSFARVDDTDADWKARASIWRDSRTVVGASDAGAHLDMLTTFSFATDLLSLGVRKHSLLTLEEAVKQLTGVPAGLYGLARRGLIVEGYHADVVVFDEETVECGAVTTRFDLPGGAGRLYAAANGVETVLVNGVPIVEAGEMTGQTPGTLLRSGRDTDTPDLK
jgi:N-acyl-D-aspartate/D-glutamate deacylase